MNRLILCVLLLTAESVMGRCVPESGYSGDNGVIRVSIFMDLAKEKNIKFPEGTAMLRANRLLHKACPRLPAKYSVAGRVLTNSHNRVEKIYSYVVEYDLQSIDDAVKQSEADAEKAREAERIATEKAVAEKKVADHETLGNIVEGKNGDARDVVRVQNQMTNAVALIANDGTRESVASISNSPVSKAVITNVPQKAQGSSVLLDDLTVRDIEDKIVKPKVTEKNGFKQVDIDSFGGIDPME